MEFWTCYSKSDTLSFTLSSFDIDSHNLGPKHISNIVQRTKKEAPHLERFEDTRKYNDGRLKARKMSLEEKIAYQKLEK